MAGPEGSFAAVHLSHWEVMHGTDGSAGLRIHSLVVGGHALRWGDSLGFGNCAGGAEFAELLIGVLGPGQPLGDGGGIVPRH